MTLFILAYLAGVLTIASPCIFPILPFVLARADEPFKRGGLPMLLGLAFAFAAVASLAAVAGGWAVEANSIGRTLALTLMALFGLAMIFPILTMRLTMPIASLGSRLSRWVEHRTATKGTTTTFSSIVLGVATGFVWAPCAGPILGLILTGAALRGPGIETSLLVLTYGFGAATSLGIGVLFGRRLLGFARQSARWGDELQRVLGVAVVAGVAVIWLGLDVGLLTRLSSASTNLLEQRLITVARDISESEMIKTAHAATSASPLSGPLRSLLGAPQWLNTQPLQAEDLQGKVVVVNFWTYSCINCLRSLPHIRAWAERYKDQGLVVIGVHTPEFAFEKNVANVSKASASLGVTYPVAIDNNFGVWRAFSNQAWPALYFIGADGRIRHRVLGEGQYEQSEQLIQKLLSESSNAPVSKKIIAVDGEGPQAAPDIRNLRSPETYIGYRQANNFSSPGGIAEDTSRLYRAASTLTLNRWSLAGVWTVGSEFASLNDTPGSIRHRFHARDLHLVLGPSTQGHPIRFRITIDGAPPVTNHGSDVDAEGWGTVREERLYQLVRQSGTVNDRTFEIEFYDAGVRAYAFTFG
jgi:Cytochrome c biogenesis protein